jgi:Ku protein
VRRGPACILERLSQINKSTGNRVKYRKVDAETRDEVESADIIKGYEVGKGQYLEVNPEELEEIALESKRTIEIDEFVPKDQIDELYLSNPYYLVPDGDVGAEAFAVIREAINKQGMVAIKKVVFTSREHIIALEPRGKGMLGVTLRYPYEVRKEEEAGYITCDQLLRDHLRNQQQRISDVIVGTVQGKQHQLISFWLGSAKVDNQEDPSEQQAMAA